MKVVFISNILRQARCLRRIQDFIDRGYEVKVYVFDREGDCRALPAYEYECIGVIANGDSYLKRLSIIREGVSKVFKKEGKDCLYYIFSLDIAIVAKLLSYIPLSPTDSSPKQGSSIRESLSGHTAQQSTPQSPSDSSSRQGSSIRESLSGHTPQQSTPQSPSDGSSRQGSSFGESLSGHTPQQSTPQSPSDGSSRQGSSFGKLRYVYEISDLMELTIKNKLLSKLLVWMNRRIVKHSLLSVYTSEGFVDFLHPKGTDTEKTVVMPNKLNAHCKSLPLAKERKTDIQHLRFGFAGAIRTETMYNLIKVIGEGGKHEVHLYGLFTDENNGRYSIRSLVDQYQNVFYHGPFKNPEDLPEIYSHIDIVLCYYLSSKNDLYLEPNKLYEAIYYDCPIIVADGTFVGRKVKQLNVGYTIDQGDAASLKAFVNSINQSDFDEKVAAIKAIDKDKCIDCPEFLFDRLRPILLQVV